MAAEVVAAIGTALHSVAKSDMLVSHRFLGGDRDLTSYREKAMLVSRSFWGAIAAEKCLGSFSGFASPVGDPYLPLQYSIKVLRSVAGGR